MSDIKWQRVQTIFEDALSRPPHERAGFLNEACGDDRATKAEVESLLQHDQQAPADFLRPPDPPQCIDPEAPNDIGAHESSQDSPDPLIGQRIGQYKIKAVIASGGMGNVYEAEQERPKRTVALKIMKAGLPNRSAMRRFEHESDVLARLQHPNIAQVYAAGTHKKDTGMALPFFAMELIPGAWTLTDFAEQKKLSVRRRLELFAHVCDAVHHGHQKGIIHRDLKPANILIDGEGRVKVIDFGVARATNSDVAVTTMRTDVGELIGTLQYMSPEQCEADPLGLDIRSDVYSLGVLLYELLTGRLPYDVSHRSIPSATRLICEAEPVRPSSFDRKLRGDLELIVLKAIEKNREQRYQSAADLAADVGRHLQHEPIAAKPTSRWANMTRWVIRHPIAVTAGGSLGVAMLVIVFTILAIRFLNFEPYRVEMADDRGEARLVSFGDRVLHSWPSNKHGIRTAKLFDQPKELGGAKLAVLGYTSNDDGPCRGALCAFDTAKDLNDPLWKAVLDPNDLPPALIRRRAEIGVGFLVRHCVALDIFEERAGKELVVAHQQERTTHTALRIYDFAGELLYQIWLDVGVESMYWMSGPKLLVLSGLNGAAFWKDRGHPEVKFPHASVVFAVRPELDSISKEYLSEKPTEMSLSPLWYKCLWPPESSDLRGTAPTFHEPYGERDSGRFALLVFSFARETEASIEWVIDEFGEEVDGSRESNDQFKILRDETPPQMPDINWVRLHDLPPILSPPSPDIESTPDEGSE